MGSEAPFCGGGISGIFFTSYSIFFFKILTSPKSNIFQYFQNFKHPPPILYIKNIGKIIQKFSKKYCTIGLRLNTWSHFLISNEILATL